MSGRSGRRRDILFLGTFLGLMFIAFKGDFTAIRYVLIVFLADFIIRVFVNPRFAPTLVLGRLIVGRQTPEYVGARQKKFAWVIGLILSATMFVFLVLMNAYWLMTGLICLTCLIFLFFESAFGICLGCKFYPLFFKDKVQYCPGEICERRSRQPIQKTSGRQLLGGDFVRGPCGGVGGVGQGIFEPGAALFVPTAQLHKQNERRA